MKLDIKKILSYLWPHIKKHWVSFSLIFIGYGVGIIFDQIVKPYLYKDLIDGFSSGLDKELVLKNSLHILYLLCFSILFQIIGYRTGDFANAYMESKVMKRLYDFSFGKLMNHSSNFFANNFSGSIIAKTKRFVGSFETFFDVISFQLFFAFVTLSGVLTVLFIKAPTLAWIFLCWALFYTFITILFIKKKIKYDLVESEADSAVTGRLSDVIMNILNVKIFSSGKAEKKYFADVTKDEEVKRTKTWFFGNFQNALQGLMMATLQITILFVAIKMWYSGRLSVGMIVLVQMYMFNLFDILWGLGKSLTKLIKSLTSMKEIVDIFELVPDILDPKNPEPLRIKEGSIVFDNVKFSYNQGTDILKDFNLDIKPGEHIGLVGHSGAGKSTVTKLILRFLDTTAGSILIDGQDIKNITQDDLRSVISYVPQEPILFHRTIKENILYSKPDATEEEMIAVAKKAYAHDFIVGLPKGYDTLVGERGVKLSGGERQRVAIARAMLKDAPVLILDEATSSLDSLSEKYIQEAFVELMKNKTTVVIAHRLSTIQKMDKIVVMNEGDIIESGTHSELIKKDGTYAELWNHQSGGFIEE